MYISKEFKFDAAHNLVCYDGKCENLHGHTYRLKVTLSGNPDAESGMIIDFNILQKIIDEKVIEKLDHNYLNNIIKQSTAENIIRWIWNELKTPLTGETYGLYEIVLWETDSSSVTVRNDS